MENNCGIIHQLFNSMEKYKFPFNKDKIPKNGIYILFENGEIGHSTNRIVRIGTHTGNDQLQSRLLQHFSNENKDRSIFRKNIGRALLSKNNDPYLEIWDIDFTTKKSKDNFKHLIDHQRQNKIEKSVTKYLQDNFSFIVFEVENKKERLELESKLISTVSLCNECKPSKNWLGKYSPNEKIRKSGLWLVNELWKKPLDKNDINIIKNIVKKAGHST